MKTNSTQQEVLLITGTTFSARQWCEKNGNENEKNFTEKEKLEDACWNGLLQEMLPEICTQPGIDKKLFLWQIRQASSFIELEFGEVPEDKENYFSIDPYLSLPLRLLS
jgi:hypothetical protein